MLIQYNFCFINESCVVKKSPHHIEMIIDSRILINVDERDVPHLLCITR